MQSGEDRFQSSIGYMHWLMARDSKCNPLKTLQGKIWQQGYERGDLNGEVYADVPPAFARWQQQGLEICIYSSGSVLAQQLLFRSTPAGNLTRFISSFFDTRIGAKNEISSYTKIADAMGRNTSEILFVSDATKEVEAARIASMTALLCVRDAKDPERLSSGDFISTFDQIFPLS
jgi:enolase-phosphatase E1